MFQWLSSYKKSQLSFLKSLHHNKCTCCLQEKKYKPFSHFKFRHHIFLTLKLDLTAKFWLKALFQNSPAPCTKSRKQHRTVNPSSFHFFFRIALLFWLVHVIGKVYRSDTSLQNWQKSSEKFGMEVISVLHIVQTRQTSMCVQRETVLCASGLFLVRGCEKQDGKRFIPPRYR